MEPSKRSRWSANLIVLLCVVALGGIATVLSVQRAVESERIADERAASLVAAQLAAGLSASLFALSGADALAADGAVTEGEFVAYAQDVIPGSDYTALSYSDVVLSNDRAQWEAETGHAMVDTDGQGGFTPSATRDRHVAVRFVFPSSSQTQRLLGFDLTSDQTRSRGVTESTDAPTGVFVGPIRLADSAQPGLFAIKAVHGVDDEVVAYVASGINLDALIERLQQPGLEPVAITMDGEPLVERDDTDATSSFMLAGRTFQVASGDTDGISWLLPALLAIGTVVMCGAVGLAGRRERFERQRQQWLLTRNDQLAQLAELLIATGTSESVLQVATNRSAGVIGAKHTTIARRLDSDRDTVEVIHDNRLAGDLSLKFARQPISADLPVMDCLREQRTVFVPNLDGYRAQYPHLLDDVVRAGVQAVLYVPITLGGAGASAAMGFGFEEPLSPRRLDDLEDAAQLVGQMVGRAYERALVREVVQHRVQLLSEYTGAIASAHSVDDIQVAVGRLLPPILDLESATIEQGDEGDTSGRRYALSTPDGDQLVLRTREDIPWTTTSEALTRAVIEILDGAMQRARVYEHEHSVLQRLQESLLAPPPVVPSFEIAVAYRSAIESVGIGGDWYSVIDLDDAIYAVIGDVAGHGPGAVAVMAQVKTIIRHLLMEGMPMTLVLQHASEHLEQRRGYASAVVVRIDKQDGTMTYVNAGHLQGLVRHGGTTTLLPETHRPWLGLDGGSIYPSTANLPIGATLLLYTDGLVEDRGTPINESIAALAAQLTGTDDDPAALVERLLNDRASTRTARSVDDDIAIIAVRRIGP